MQEHLPMTDPTAKLEFHLERRVHPPVASETLRLFVSCSLSCESDPSIDVTPSPPRRGFKGIDFGDRTAPAYYQRMYNPSYCDSEANRRLTHALRRRKYGSESKPTPVARISRLDADEIAPSRRHHGPTQPPEPEGNLSRGVTSVCLLAI